MASIAAVGGLPLKGTAPVNTCVDMNQTSIHNRQSATYFDHDHCERENIRLLAMCSPLVQDLRCSPSCGMLILIQDVLHRISVVDDRGNAEIRNAGAVRIIYEDIGLARHQDGCAMRVRMVTHPFEAPVNHIARVEVVEAFSDISHLMRG